MLLTSKAKREGTRTDAAESQSGAHAILLSYLSLDEYSISILHLWSTKWPYFSRKSMPF